MTTDFERLVNDGVDLPEPGAMEDDQLARKLAEVITGLARVRVYLSHTDHLSDRDLYAKLWYESLREEISDDEHPDTFWHLEPIGGGSLEDIRAYLTFYADDKARRHWLEQFPGEELPAHEEPPFDRDRHLPRPACAL